jgi:PncC family amidohydrolase
MSEQDEEPGQLPDEQVLGATLHAELTRHGLRLATAESLTGGALADLVSASPGASESYLGGIVSYATSVKTTVLGVSEQTVRTHGVVSAECAEEMAARARELIGADWAISTTESRAPPSRRASRSAPCSWGWPDRPARPLTSSTCPVTGRRYARRPAGPRSTGCSPR